MIDQAKGDGVGTAQSGIKTDSVLLVCVRGFPRRRTICWATGDSKFVVRSLAMLEQLMPRRVDFGGRVRKSSHQGQKRAPRPSGRGSTGVSMTLEASARHR